MDILTEVKPTDLKERQIEVHLGKIDPTLVHYASQSSKTPFKDLSTPERLVTGKDTLLPTDLVAVHLTDTFPENGIIHPSAFYDPQTARFTTHFTINSLAPEIPIYGWNWKDKKYGILIPFQGIQQQVLGFNPADTFVLDDLHLPQGSVIVTSEGIAQNLGSSGSAKVLEADFSKAGQRLSGFQRAIYEQMIQMGYFPQVVSPVGEWISWGSYSLPNGQTYYGINVWREFCKRNNLEYAGGASPHASHWTGQLEDFASFYLYYKSENDEYNANEVAHQARIFLDVTEIPDQYKQALQDIINQT